MIGITKKQSEVLAFIKAFIDTNGYSPSFQEIGIGMGLTSLATVAKHVEHLQKRGRITLEHKRRRSIAIV